MQKILKWLAPLIAVGVAIFIVFFLISINSNELVAGLTPLKHKSQIKKEEQTKTWLSNFSKTEKLGYFYPVNEVLIQIDLNEKVQVKAVYKLIASLLDPYQLFCLKEELGNHKLKYYLIRDKKGVELLIYSSDRKKLNSLVRVLKNYQIIAKISLYKEDV